MINLNDVPRNNLKMAIYFNPDTFNEEVGRIYGELVHANYLDVYPKRFTDNYFSIYNAIKNNLIKDMTKGNLCKRIGVEYAEGVITDIDAIIKISNFNEENNNYGFGV